LPLFLIVLYSFSDWTTKRTVQHMYTVYNDLCLLYAWWCMMCSPFRYVPVYGQYGFANCAVVVLSRDRGDVYTVFLLLCCFARLCCLFSFRYGCVLKTGSGIGKILVLEEEAYVLFLYRNSWIKNISEGKEGLLACIVLFALSIILMSLQVQCYWSLCSILLWITYLNLVSRRGLVLFCAVLWCSHSRCRSVVWKYLYVVLEVCVLFLLNYYFLLYFC
jgi:hypothetical protein